MSRAHLSLALILAVSLVSLPSLAAPPQSAIQLSPGEGIPGVEIDPTLGSYPKSPSEVGITAAACPNWSNRTYGGTITASSNGQVISNMELTGGVTVDANDVTISCVRIGTTASPSNNRYGINCTTFGGGSSTCDGLTIKNVELRMNGNNSNNNAASAAVALWGDDVTLENSYLEGGVDAIKTGGNRIMIRGNWLHCNRGDGSSAPHMDVVQTRKGSSLSWINNMMRARGCPNSEHNANGHTQNLFVQNNDGPVNKVLVQGNFFYGGNGLIKWDADLGPKGKGAISNLTVKNNFAEKGFFLFSEVVNGFEYSGSPSCYHWSGNQYSDGTAWNNSGAKNPDSCPRPDPVR